MTTLTALDIGYGYTKAHANQKTITFPSVVGLATDVRYIDQVLGQSTANIQINHAGQSYFIGDQALSQSSLHWTALDRQRTGTETYLILLLAALAQLDLTGPLNIVTGLPVAWFQDREKLLDQLTGKHTYNECQIDIQALTIIPQPFGSLYNLTLNAQGKIIAPDIAAGTVGVIDIGTHTTDFVIAERFRYNEPGSGSVPIGMAKIHQTLGDYLQRTYNHSPGAYKIDQALQRAYIKIRGQRINLGDRAEPIINATAQTILGEVIKKWEDYEGDLDTIIITGGGADTIGPYLTSRFPHAAIIPEGHLANVLGYYRLGLFKQAQTAKSKKHLNGASQ